MSFALLNALLALCWAALSGTISAGSLLTGFVLGFGALWFARDMIGSDSRYFRSVLRSIRLAFYFLWELVKSCVAVAGEVLARHPRMRPAIVEMPLGVKSDLEIMLVANLITLTPGTLTVDVTPDRSALIIHALFADDPEATVAELKSGMERMVREVFE